MNEHPLLALLAQFTGDFIAANNPSTEDLQAFHLNVANALLQEQPVDQLQHSFQFETMQDVTTQHLNADDLQYLNTVLQNAEKEANIDNILRVFRREVPFVSSQVKGSVPEWARGAKIEQTIGPLINQAGQRFWWDLYRVVPGVQLYLQGAAQPAMVLSVQVSRFFFFFNSHTDYAIPLSSIWINAHLISTAAPDNEFCGLTIKKGNLHFTNNVELNNGKMIVPPGTVVTVSLELEQQTDSSVSPDNTGIDAKNASVNLPQTFSFTFSDAGSQVTAAGDASWTVYAQADNFSFLPNTPAFYLAQFNRVCIPYQSSAVLFDAANCLSSVCNIKDSAPVEQSAWSLSCAVLDINNPLAAKGIGAMMIKTGKGLSIGWYGLQDINLQDKEWIDIRSPWILAEPGRIAVTDSNAGNTNARQQYKLWKNKKGQWNIIDLQYTNNFLFFYNCLQAGNEAVLAFANCTGTIDRPVDVAGKPFALNSKQTIYLLTWSQALQLVLLYDDNLLIDNEGSNPFGEAITFKSQAIALNNALLTVSPVTGFFLAGDLKSEQEFIKAALIESFGLLGYMPTLPDPYAADLDIFKDVYRIYGAYNKEGGIPIYAIRQLLVCIITWPDDNIPDVNFTWGDIASPANNNQQHLQNIEAIQGVQVPLNLLSNQNLAVQRTQQNAVRRSEILNKQYSAAGIADHPVTEMSSLAYSRGNDRVGQTSLFSLLDVSTNADLFGVNLGFVNEQFIFRRMFDVQPVDTTKNPLAIMGMDVVATSRFVRIFTVPQISWEPVLNLTPAFNAAKDPPFGVLKFDTDGFPVLIGNTGLKPVTLAPIPLTNEVVKNYKEDTTYKAWSLFTLPNGMVSMAVYDQDNYYVSPHPNVSGSTIELIKASFTNGTKAGMQIVTKAGANPGEDNHVFEGFTIQEFNIKSVFQPGTWSVLGETVTDIFNNEFGNDGIIHRGVPLERYDFTGYGANIFSNWLNKGAEIAAVSKAIFDVWRGRTAKEVIQVRTILYPWAVRVVRTITLYRSSTGFEYRVDSGWRADSNGEYQFRNRFPAKDAGGNVIKNPDGSFQFIDTGEGYTFHPGLVRGVYNVRNIVENDLAPYKKIWNKPSGYYVNEDDGQAYLVNDPVHPLTAPLEVELVPVYFDADVLITDVDGTTPGAGGIPSGDYITSKKMLGYLQKAPRGIIISADDFANLLDLQNGLGGSVDCILNVNGSGQKMRISRVEVNHSRDEANQLVFVSAAKGMPILPKDGSWSLVSHNKTSKEVHPITDASVSLIRKGVLGSAKDILNSPLPKEITPASELFKVAEDRLTQFAFLQNTDTQKVLYRNPYFQAGENLLHSTKPDLGDAYRLLNSKGVFPNLDNLPSIDLDAAGCATKIIEQGYQMVDKVANNILKPLEQDFADGASFTFIDKPGILKVYAEYANTNIDKSVNKKGKLNLDLNSQANNWLNKMNDITMVVDLVSFERLFLIKGKFDTQKGSAPSFSGDDPSSGPKLIPGTYLKPIIEILEILEVIGTSPDYASIAKKALQIAMSNSPNNWEYKFQADKEIPVLQFPPAYLDGPTTPLRLEANLKLGIYFNLAVPIPPDGLPGLSAGGFIEFGAKLSVMCVSLAVATVYAVGQVTLRISGDTVKGPGLYMKMGFGIELMVGIPVVGNVSVYYAVGVEISLDTKDITVAAFILFRGRAELIGGLVTITIQIEAAGKIHKELGSGRTDCIAQVTFSIDVSVLFVIDIHDTEQWQEARQIA